MRARLSRRPALLITAALAAFLAATGCASNRHAAAPVEDEAYCRSVKPGVITSVNSTCVVVPDHPVDPAVTNVEWKGRQVGFCCEGCKPRWAKMSEAQRDAAVARAMAAPTPAPTN